MTEVCLLKSQHQGQVLNFLAYQFPLRQDTTGIGEGGGGCGDAALSQPNFVVNFRAIC